ncbi:MAG: hypothetical protein JSU08_04030 [Acidobacteria bacterium]|nr:hypothetical protein [Acidobacteriota bacterium]
MYINEDDGQMRGDDELMLDPAVEARVTSALKTLESIEPPAEFVAQVMWRTRQAQIAPKSALKARVTSGRRPRIPARALLMGVMGIAAVALIALFVTGRTPALVSGTEGAIGGAARYGDDAAAESAVDAFTHTPAYPQLMRDRTALQLLEQPEVQRVFAMPGAAAALGNRGIRQALLAGATLADPATGKPLASRELSSLLASAAVRAVVAIPAVQAALDTPAFVDGLSRPGFLRVLCSRANQ